MSHALFFSVLNGKLQESLTFLLMSFCQYSELFIWEASVFGSHYPVNVYC